MHVDASRDTIPGLATVSTLKFTSVTATRVAGAMTVRFPGDPAPSSIVFDATNCNATL